jgi:hypothetical protein
MRASEIGGEINTDSNAGKRINNKNNQNRISKPVARDARLSQCDSMQIGIFTKSDF